MIATCPRCSNAGYLGDRFCACPFAATLRDRIETAPEFAEFRRKRAEVDRLLRNLEAGDHWRSLGCPPGEIKPPAYHCARCKAPMHALQGCFPAPEGSICHACHTRPPEPRYLTVPLPKHITLSLRHNPHAGDYTPLETWLENYLLSAEAGGETRDEAIAPEDLAAIRATGEVWELSWCPASPVGSCSAVAATLERVLELAGGEPDRPTADREAWWRALTDQQRSELIDLGCRHCGSLDPRCYCQRDD